jgi:mannose-6-phosphate isomerase-like protein (cupin superfamily)
MPQSSKNYCKNFNAPDETRPFQGHGHLELVNFFDGSGMGRGIFQPGWKWSNDVKPIAETESCQEEHHGYCISGSMTIHMDDGDEFKIQEGHAYIIPAGHDAWVDGNEDCVLLDMTGYKSYARQKSKAA